LDNFEKSYLHNTYMALQPRFGQGLSEKIPPLYLISSVVRPVTGLKGPTIAVHAIRPPRFQSSLVSSAFQHGPKQGSLWWVLGTPYLVPNVAQSIALHDADDIWAVFIVSGFILI
jgi:hypothetical protein